MKHIFFCNKCKNFTIKETCSCGEKSLTTKPPKYSPDFKYANLRREAKREELEKKGFL